MDAGRSESTVPDRTIRAWNAQLLETGRARHPGTWVGPEPETPRWMWSPINVLILRGASTVLVDAGTGILAPWWPFDGFEDDVVSALARVGLAPEEVDLVVVTHLDFDHVGGLVSGSWPDGLELVFANASVAVPAAAAAWARSADPDEPLNAGSRIVEHLRREGRLIEVAASGEAAPGLVLRAAPGHRPGHSLVEIDCEPALIHGGDVLHHALHAEHPEWDGLADADRELGLATRRGLLAELATRGTCCVFSHVPGPRPMRVLRDGDGFRLVSA
jgi:glyoxylase-like metal-dependent hydrolase (beta-lactamase superfamily II)